MSVADDFEAFCSHLAVYKRADIAYRYAELTKRLNRDFWNSDSDSYHSFYTGSFGRGTAIGLTSDVDMVFRLPYEVYVQYDGYQGNGQSALLQAVRESIKKRYTVTEIGADGQVVVVPFDDGIKFEVLPAFLNKDESYTFPDSNDGGRWRTTNPKPEIEAINKMDKDCNYNLKPLCKMARAWKSEWAVPMNGLLIDTLAYNFIQNWKERDKSFLYYDWMSRDFFDNLRNQNEKQEYWYAPGSGQRVDRRGNFEYKALRCYNLSLEAIKSDSDEKHWSARQTWREIYGTSFPE
jgi:hypothetical protein